MIRVALADDHDIVRSGFRMILEAEHDIEVVGEAAEGSQAYRLVAQERPDILLLDISMPEGQNGLSACKSISDDFPHTKIIILTMFAEAEYLQFAMKNGASGYFIKSATANELACAIRSVAEGDTYIHPKMREALDAHLLNSPAENSTGLLDLSARDLEILKLLAYGYTNKQVSERLFLSVKTIEAHRSKIYTKLNINNRSELVDFAIKHKLFNL